MPEKTIIAVHVTPRSGRDEVVGVTMADAPEVCVRVTVPPDKGKANKAACKVVASALGVPKSAVEVVSGATSRHKRLAVGCSSDCVSEWLRSLPMLG